MSRKEIEHIVGYAFFAGLALLGMWMGSLLTDSVHQHPELLTSLANPE